MADDESVPQIVEPARSEKASVKRDSLRYLEFLHVAAIQTVLFVARIYSYAKERSGPLKPRVQSVESTVKGVVGPVYDRFHDVPFELLKFVDQKVGESAQKLEHHIPPSLKNASAVARSAAGEIQRNGLVNSATSLSRYVYTKYEPAAEQAAVSLWRSVNRLPLVPQAAHIVLPTAAHLAKKYNQTVSYTAAKGYAFSAYLPLFPTERISRVFSGEAIAQ
ncbi:stress-related protein-like [Zingiber officinale]|uniref:stress-related protein-like n=1 Tax=Zingiber officinale TaxID=94328 RepID=UPI001C4B6CB9|nr:stress-related protein-like [Zingiber officinale]